MKSLTFLLGMALSVFQSYSQTLFDDYFTTGSMRIDYVMTGNHETFGVSIHNYFHEPYWGGSQSNLHTEMKRGDFYFSIEDRSSGKTIYTRGFNSLFAEWQTTNEAAYVDRAFEGTIRFPYPKYEIVLSMFKRSGYHDDSLIFQTVIDPNDFLIEKRDPATYEVREIQIQGDPAVKADLVFLADGYMAHEMEKYILDVKRFTDYLFTQEPFKTNREKFNVRAISSISKESGPDNPGIDLWNNTVLNTSFYTFGSERYLTTMSYWKVCDVASVVPYDHIIILVNSSKYGGGGVYNHYSLSSAGNELSEIVLVHELGHGFAGLGDEYYTSDVAYSDYYDLQKEPVEPNLTTLVDFEVKWKSMISEGTSVPTPVTSDFKGETGVFEGGGYSAKGIYRPETDCRMKSNKADRFCKVCQAAILEMINYYSE